MFLPLPALRSVCHRLVRLSVITYRNKSNLAGILACLLFVIFGSLGAVAQSYGPPCIVTQGVLYAYTGEGTIPDPNGDGGSYPVDIYGWTFAVGPDSNLYDTSGNFVGGYFFGVASDRQTILGSSPGLVVLDSNGADGQGLLTGQPNYWPFWNGSSYESKYENIPQYTVFQTASSIWDYYPGNDPSGNDVVISASGASNIFAPPPQNIYISGIAYSLQTFTPTASGTSYSDSVTYSSPTGDTAGIDRYFSNGAPTGGDIWGYIGAQSFTGQYNPLTGVVQIDPDSTVVSVNAAPSGGAPADGKPSYGSWDNVTLAFYYTTQNGDDVYWNAGDSSGDYTLVLKSDNTVVAVHGSETLTGTCDPVSFALNFSGAPDSGELFLLNSAGIPYGLPPGAVFLFGSNGPGATILLKDGSSATPAYSFRQPNGSWGVKYVSLPDGPLLVADEAGNYTAPPYVYASTRGDLIESAVTGWPQTNLHPQQLYINGIPYTLDPSSEYYSGAGIPKSGGATYRPANNSLSALLSWSSNPSFTGSVTATDGQGNPFIGAWDGLATFSNLPSGMTVSVSPLPNGPVHGPPQISINNVPFIYSPTLSAASGLDTYRRCDREYHLH